VPKEDQRSRGILRDLRERIPRLLLAEDVDPIRRRLSAELRTCFHSLVASRAEACERAGRSATRLSILRIAAAYRRADSVAEGPQRGLEHDELTAALLDRASLVRVAGWSRAGRTDGLQARPEALDLVAQIRERRLDLRIARPAGQFREPSGQDIDQAKRLTETARRAAPEPGGCQIGGEPIVEVLTGVHGLTGLAPPAPERPFPSRQPEDNGPDGGEDGRGSREAHDPHLRTAGRVRSIRILHGARPPGSGAQAIRRRIGWAAREIGGTPMSLAASEVTLVRALIVVTMFSIGLGVTTREILGAIGRPRLLAGTLVANLLIVPGAAWLLSQALNLPAGIEAGFLLTACSAGAPIAPKLVQIARGDVPTAVGLLFVLAALAVVTVPVTASLILPAALDVSVPIGPAVRSLLLLLLAPLVAGLAVRQWRSEVAARLGRPATVASNVLFAVAVLVILIHDGRYLPRLGWRPISAMLVLVAVALAIGAAVAGHGKGDRRAVALSTAERASGLALLIAVDRIGDPVAIIAIVALGVCMLVVNMATATWAGRIARRPHPANAESG
jgi:bile acid:Na+ symporter, BASS family